MRKIEGSNLSVELNRAFPSCYEPHYESEAKCKSLLCEK